jgi:ADP-heptose:LPS heptosyltransferase
MRILLIRPCCIGDVVLATAALTALRSAYPDAHITWAVGSWSRRAIEHHPVLNSILDTGKASMPVKSPLGFAQFVAAVRAGGYDLLLSLVRSPLMSAAALLTGVRQRVGLDSNGRGFGYTLRVPVNPDEPRHEAEIYLDAVRALGVDTAGQYASIPVPDDARVTMQALLARRSVHAPYIVINPAGGNNPGMVMSSKRWPPANFAALGDALAERYSTQIVLVAGPDDAAIVNEVRAQMQHTVTTFIGELSFMQIGALAAGALLYVGNDTGLTHLAAAAGGKTAAIFGPSDPRRYAPYTPDSIALWKPSSLDPRGVAAADKQAWDWSRDGISGADALAQLEAFLQPGAQ